MNKIIIHQIYDKFKNQSFEIFKIRDAEYPPTIDIKNALVYYIMYIWHKNNNNKEYLTESLNFILIPNNIFVDFSNFNSMEDYIDIHQYIKYNFDNLNINLKTVNEEVDKEIEFNKYKDISYIQKNIKKFKVKELNIILKQNNIEVTKKKLRKNEKIVLVRKYFSNKENQTDVSNILQSVFSNLTLNDSSNII